MKSVIPTYSLHSSRIHHPKSLLHLFAPAHHWLMLQAYAPPAARNCHGLTAEEMATKRGFRKLGVAGLCRSFSKATSGPQPKSFRSLSQAPRYTAESGAVLKKATISYLGW